MFLKEMSHRKVYTGKPFFESSKGNVFFDPYLSNKILKENYIYIPKKLLYNIDPRSADISCRIFYKRSLEEVRLATFNALWRRFFNTVRFDFSFLSQSFSFGGKVSIHELCSYFYNVPFIFFSYLKFFCTFSFIFQDVMEYVVSSSVKGSIAQFFLYHNTKVIFRESNYVCCFFSVHFLNLDLRHPASFRSELFNSFMSLCYFKNYLPFCGEAVRFLQVNKLETDYVCNEKSTVYGKHFLTKKYTFTEAFPENSIEGKQWRDSVNMPWLGALGFLNSSEDSPLVRLPGESDEHFAQRISRFRRYLIGFYCMTRE